MRAARSPASLRVMGAALRERSDTLDQPFNQITACFLVTATFMLVPLNDFHNHAEHKYRVAVKQPCLFLATAGRRGEHEGRGRQGRPSFLSWSALRARDGGRSVWQAPIALCRTVHQGWAGGVVRLP